MRRNGPVQRPVCFGMETTTEYQRYAEECRRLARQAKTEQHRRILEEMAQAWEELAKEEEPTGSHASG